MTSKFSVYLVPCELKLLAQKLIVCASPGRAGEISQLSAGIDTVLFFLTLKKVHALKGTREG